MNRIVGMKESCESRPGGGMNNRAPGTPRGNWGCWKSPERPALVMLSPFGHVERSETSGFCNDLRVNQILRFAQNDPSSLRACEGIFILDIDI